MLGLAQHRLTRLTHRALLLARAVWLCATVGAGSAAAEPEFPPHSLLSAEQSLALAEQLDRTALGCHAFTQRRALPGTTIVLTSTGTLQLSEQRLLWRVEQPRFSEYLIDEGGRSWRRDAADAPLQAAAEQRKRKSDLQRLTSAMFTRDATLLQNTFSLHRFDAEPDRYLATPRDRRVRAVIQNIVFVTRDDRLQEATLYDARGQSTTLVFTSDATCLELPAIPDS